MSLLMDALKRAEQAKREQGGQDNTLMSGELQLEPTPPPVETRSSPLPDINSHLESVEADLKATAAERPLRPTPPPKPDLNSARAVAQNVLAAGAAPVPATPAAPPRGRLFLIIGIGVGCATALGGYFYWQLQGLTQNGSRLAATPLATQAPKPVAINPAPSAPAPTPVPSQIAVAPLPSPSGTAQVEAPLPKPAPLTGAPRVGDKTPQPLQKGAGKAAPEKTPKPRSGGTDLAATQEPGKILPASPSKAPLAPAEGVQVNAQTKDSAVMRGYTALQTGRLPEAKAAYAHALRADSRDPDALLGLASIARQEGDAELAGDYYERALRSDPRNATAHAGLISLQGVGDSSQAESRLKSLLHLQNSDPNATSSLNFALGNLYAGQRRWSEAQQAFFKAYTADAGNPDTLFNLAISLEHLNQKSLARQYYERALQAGRHRAAAFDRAQAEQRLGALPR